MEQWSQEYKRDWACLVLQLFLSLCQEQSRCSLSFSLFLFQFQHSLALVALNLDVTTLTLTTLRPSRLHLPLLPLLPMLPPFSRSPTCTKVPLSYSSYSLSLSLSRLIFFRGWNFFTGPDPTNGLVNYLDQDSATSSGLAYIQPDGTTVLAVDNSTQVPVGANRNSYVSLSLSPLPQFLPLS